VPSLAVKELWISLNISQSYRHELGVLFFDSRCSWRHSQEVCCRGVVS